MVNNDRIWTKPLNFTISKKVAFPIANENLIPIAKNLRKLSGIKYYLGICGGGTQNLYLLQLLTKKNRFKSKRLIDNNKEQLLNFIDITNVLAYSKGDLNYMSNLVKRPHLVERRYVRYFYSLFKNKSHGFEKTNLKMPNLKNTEIELVCNEFLRYIKSEKLPKGKYFVYVSNIFGYTKMSLRLWCCYLWNIIKEIKNGDFRRLKERAELNHTRSEIEKAITKNKYILNGSIILAWLGGIYIGTKEKKIALFKKTRSRIEILDTVVVPD